MKMLIMTFRDSLEEEVLTFLSDNKIHAYTYIPKVHGTGTTGAAFGRFLTHGENGLILTTLSDEDAHRMTEAFRSFRARLSERQQHAVIPARLMVVPCEEII